MIELEFLKKTASDLADAAVKASQVISGDLDGSQFNQASKYIADFLEFVEASSSVLRKSLAAAETMQKIKNQ